MKDFREDLRFTFRAIRSNRLLVLVVVATLVLGIGISTGIFTLLTAIGLRARVDQDPGSYVQVFASYTDGRQAPRFGPPALNDYTAMRDRSKSLRNVAAWQNIYGPLGTDDPVEARGLLVTCNFFALHTLTQPKLGRLLEPEDCEKARPVTVISEEVWRTVFASDAAIVGRSVHFNSQPLTVVGVTPSPFAGRINRARLWMPHTLQSYLNSPVPKLGAIARMDVGARLNSGYSRRDATAELALIAAQQDRLQPGRRTSIFVSDGSFIQQPGFDQKAMLVIPLITGVVTLIVILASVNVTTLLLARADARQHEIAIRLAMGASKLRLVRMLLTEMFVLASIAAVASLYLASSIPQPVHTWLTGEPAEYPLNPDWRVAMYLAIITLMAAVLSGLTPALQSMSVNLVDALKGRRRVFGGSGAKSRLHGLLVVAQVALSMVLLIGGAVFVRAYLRMADANPGFETRQALIANMRAGTSVPLPVMRATIVRHVQSLPGVVSTAWATSGPSAGEMLELQIPGQAVRRIEANSVSPDFFATVAIPVIRGRGLDRADASRTGVQPAVVSEEFVRQFSATKEVLGQTFRSTDGKVIEVVGVARDTAAYGDTDGPIVYRPWSDRIEQGMLLVRFAGDGERMSRAVSAAIRDAVPGIAVTASTFAAQMEGSLARFWHLAVLILMLGGVGLLLAVLGIYGVISFSARRRAKEVGIRVALGASRQHILAAVLKPGLRPVGVGLVVGLMFALALSPALARAVQGARVTIETRDPVAYVGVALVLAAAAVTAMLLPARRAATADPMKALRDE